MVVQIAIAQHNGPTFQNVEGMKAPRGRQAIPGDAAGWDMSVGFSYYAEVLCRHMTYISGDY